jgi:hypothetical protein
MITPRKVAGRVKRRVFAEWERIITAFLRSRPGAWLARRLGRTIVLVIGDSHVESFRTIRRRRLLPRVWVDTAIVRAASAMGIANDASHTGALQQFRAVLARVPTSRQLIVILGEVDTGRLLWVRAERDGTAVDVQLHRSFTNYTAFLAELLAAGRPVAVGAIAPQIVHERDLPKSAAWLRRTLTVPLTDRIAVTRSYNALLRAWCAEHGAAFLDWEADSVDPVSGAIRDELRPVHPYDNHPNPATYAPVAARHIAALLGGRPLRD